MKKTLHAYYDLMVSPASFDFFTFMISAELYRERHKFEKINFYIIPGPKDGFRDDDLPCALKTRQMMLRNIVLEGPHLLPSCSGVTWLSDRENVEVCLRQPERGVFPPSYHLNNPTFYYMIGALNFGHFLGSSLKNLLTAPHEYQAIISDYLKKVSDNKKVISITLRNNPENPERNANFPEWQKMCEYLESKDYMPVLVHETANVHKQDDYFSAYPYCDLASTSVLYRTALYEQSYLNLFVNNGPENCAKYSNSRSITFKMLTDSNISTSEKWYQFHHGFRVGDQLPYFPKRHVISWDEDNFGAMKTTFNKMVRDIEKSPEKLEQLHGMKDDAQTNLFLSSVTRQILWSMKRIVTYDDVVALKKLKDITDADLGQIIKDQFKESHVEIFAAINKVAKTHNIEYEI